MSWLSTLPKLPLRRGVPVVLVERARESRYVVDGVLNDLEVNAWHEHDSAESGDAPRCFDVRLDDLFVDLDEPTGFLHALSVLLELTKHEDDANDEAFGVALSLAGDLRALRGQATENDRVRLSKALALAVNS